MKGILPPVVPYPLARLSRHVLRETDLQYTIEVEVGPIRQPIQAVLVKSSRQVRIQGQLLSRRVIVGIDLLVRVMNTFVRTAGKDFDVGFLTVDFVKKRA